MVHCAFNQRLMCDEPVGGGGFFSVVADEMLKPLMEIMIELVLKLEQALPKHTMYTDQTLPLTFPQIK